MYVSYVHIYMFVISASKYIQHTIIRIIYQCSCEVVIYEYVSCIAYPEWDIRLSVIIRFEPMLNVIKNNSLPKTKTKKKKRTQSVSIVFIVVSIEI